MAEPYKQNTDNGMNRLKSALREKNPERLYFFTGEEEYLKSYYYEQLSKQLLDGPAEEFNFHRFNPETFSMEAFLNAVDALPMMAERSLIRIDDVDPFKLGEDERKRFADLFGDIPEYCCIVFFYTASALKPDKRQKALWGAISENGLIVSFEKQSEKELVAWLARRFRSFGKELDPKLGSYLYFISDKKMTSLIGEVEKIAAYSEGSRITREDIDAVVEPVLEAVVFDITDSLAGGSYSDALSRLQQVLRKGEEPLTVLGAISAQFRRMRAARLLRENGQGADALCRLCGLSPYPARKLTAAADRVSLRFCSRAVLLCEETDLKLKSSYDEPTGMLELLLLRLAEEAKLG